MRAARAQSSPVLDDRQAALSLRAREFAKQVNEITGLIQMRIRRQAVGVCNRRCCNAQRLQLLCRCLAIMLARPGADLRVECIFDRPAGRG